MKRLIIIGGGAFGREVYHWAQQHPDCGKNWAIHGFLDDNSSALAGYNYPVTVLGAIEGHQPSPEDLYLCAITHPRTKETLCRKLQAQGAEFVTLLHPSVVLGGNVELGAGSVISPNCVLTCDIQLGDFTMLNCGVTIGHDVSLGHFCTINGNAELTGGVQLGERVFVGSHATTHPGTIIRNDAKIGLGSAAIGIIKEGQSVMGIPARAI